MTRRLRTPILLLLLVLGGFASPAGQLTAGPSAVVTHVAATRPSTLSRTTHDRVEHHATRPLMTAAQAASHVPVQSTPARDSRPGAPRLLLVQRPRPPNAPHPASELSAPTGRSPPSPAGT